MGPLEWKAYLQQCSGQIVEDGNHNRVPTLPESVIQRKWLGYEGASRDAIRQTEHRLGIKLPPSLRSFYSVTNGWRTVGCFIYEVPSVEKIGWLSDIDPDLYQIGAGVEAQFGGDPRADLREYAYEGGTRVKRSLAASAWGDASTWLLDPETVNNKGEWAGGRWSSWNPGMEWSADSFEDLFRAEYKSYRRLIAEN